MAKKKGNYLTIKESRQIIKYNIKQMKYYEALKKKKMDPSEYKSIMKDENNIVEIDNENKLIGTNTSNQFNTTPIV